jgi:hypothetical protein
MTLATARKLLSVLRPTVPSDLNGVQKWTYGWVASDTHGGFYCLVTGRYICPPTNPEERFGGDER